jgi:HD-like signal output (HDOD) protein/ActR/RegA family two-component response regulator
MPCAKTPMNSVVESSLAPIVPGEPRGASRAPLRVLFVDDDACILGGLADSLRRRPSGWDARFALGGEAALDVIAAQRFDVVVSDLSMPRVDGIAVLSRAREVQPDAARIILSGGAERGAALAAARVAHRYIAKPFREEDVRAAVERAWRLRSMLREEGWRRAAGGVMALPSCPRIYTELSELIADPDATATDAAAILERDVAMTAKVLQLVNSAFFGLARRVSRIPEAVHYLGLSTLRALVLHAGAFEAFAPTRPIEGFDIHALQRRSHLAARIAQRMAPDRPTREDAFTASMLHGVGLLVLARSDPYELGELIAAADDRAMALHEVEYEWRGSSDAELGAYVLGMWGLPDPIVEGVAHHHRADRLLAPGLEIALVVHVATVLAAELVPGALAAAPGRLDMATLAAAGAADEVPAWRALAVAEAARG